jgi:Tfp pilus assembly protein PilV
VVAVVLGLVAVVLLAMAVLASLSFHTQAQHNYLVVALLPNQAVTSFTHSHLLAHLALCHL